MSRALPNQPRASTQLTAQPSPKRTVTVARHGRLAGLDRHPAADVHGGLRGEPGHRHPAVGFLGDAQHRAERAAGERGVLLGLGAGVLEGGGAGPLEQRRRVGHVEGDVVEAERVAGRPGQGLDQLAHPVAVAHQQPQALVRGVADDPVALAVPAGGDPHAGGAPVGRGHPVVGHRLQRGGHPPGRGAQGAGDVGRLALDPRVEHDDVGHRARGAGPDDFHVVGHAGHCRAARGSRWAAVSAYLSVAG